MAKKQTKTSIPMDIDAEESILGTIIQNADALKQASTLLAPDDFWSDEAAKVFNACMKLFSREEKVSKSSLINLLKINNELEEIGDEAYIDKLIQASDAVFFSSNVSKVKNLSILRGIIHLANKIMNDVSEDDAQANKILQDINAELKNLEYRTHSLPPWIVDMVLATSNPRSYTLKFSDGREVEISIDDLMSANKVKKAIVNALDFMPSLPKSEDWEKFVRQLMEGAKRKLAGGADLTMDVLDTIKDLFDAQGEASEASDLRSGAYAKDEIDGRVYYLFQKRPVVNHIKQQLDKGMDTVRLWRLIQKWGGIDNKDGKPISKRIGSDSRTFLWGLPEDVIKERVIVENELQKNKGEQINIDFLEGEEEGKEEKREEEIDVSWLE